MKQVLCPKPNLMRAALVSCLMTAFFLPSCASQSSVDVLAGTYELTSAVLNHSGGPRTLECLGNFRLILSDASKSQGNAITLRVQAQGSASCRSANPASFAEKLGGDCQLAELTLTRKSAPLVYESLPGTSPAKSISCDAKLNDGQPSMQSDESVFVILPYSSDSIILNHATSSTAVFTSFVLKRLPE